MLGGFDLKLSKTFLGIGVFPRNKKEQMMTENQVIPLGNQY